MKEISYGLILVGYNVIDDEFIMELLNRLLGEYDALNCCLSTLKKSIFLIELRNPATTNYNRASSIYSICYK